MGNDPSALAARYDIITLGGDLSRLAAAARYASEGKKVLVLIGHNAPGGARSGFRRGDFEFSAGTGENVSGREAALALDRRIRESGGEIRYKTAVRRITRDGNGAPVLELSDGSRVSAESMEHVIAPPEPGSDLRIILGTDLPYDRVRAAAAKAEGAAAVKGKDPERSCVLSLTGDFPEALFDDLREETYFGIKNRLAEEITADFEAASGLKLRGHIREMEIITPLTRARYLADSPSSGTSRFRLGGVLHPPVQFGRILEVTDRGHAKSFVIGPDPERGTASLAYFRAGQYVSIMDRIGQAVVCKPYSICSSPKDALGSENTAYTVMIERNPDGFFSPHALDTWETGTKLVLSGPLGYFYYQPLRDARHVIALAGSSGITPFYAMASAIADGIEDFDLTILYGSRTADTILLRDELEAVVRRSGGKVRVVHVLSEEQRGGFESGLISPDLIRRYAPDEDYSLFICGPKAMYAYLRRELPKLGLPPSRIRFELPGEFGDPAADPEYPPRDGIREFRLTVLGRGRTAELPCRSDQTLMQAIERAGILIEADCRSGRCGWCRSRLVSGDVFVPESRDGRLTGDAEYGWIHPCVTYPLSDLTLEIFNH